MKAEIYTRITDQIVAALKRGVTSWHRPWDVQHTEGRIVRPLRSNFEPYRGINALMLWGEAVAKGFITKVDDAPPGQRLGRSCPRRRRRLACRRRIHPGPHRDRRRGRRRERTRHPLPERLHRVQRRADRGAARTVSGSSSTRAGQHRTGCTCGCVRERHRSSDPARRRDGLLLPARRHGPYAALRVLPRRGGLLRNPSSTS